MRTGLFLLLLASCNKPATYTIEGELKKWHTVTITFDGPLTNESDEINPFLDYRLNVNFKNGQREYSVPGFINRIPDRSR